MPGDMSSKAKRALPRVYRRLFHPITYQYQVLVVVWCQSRHVKAKLQFATEWKRCPLTYFIVRMGDVQRAQLKILAGATRASCTTPLTAVLYNT